MTQKKVRLALKARENRDVYNPSAAQTVCRAFRAGRPLGGLPSPPRLSLEAKILSAPRASLGKSPQCYATNVGLF
jgi:hypothetical protein